MLEWIYNKKTNIKTHFKSKLNVVLSLILNSLVLNAGFVYEIIEGESPLSHYYLSDSIQNHNNLSKGL